MCISENPTTEIRIRNMCFYSNFTQNYIYINHMYLEIFFEQIWWYGPNVLPSAREVDIHNGLYSICCEHNNRAENSTTFWLDTISDDIFSMTHCTVFSFDLKCVQSLFIVEILSRFIVLDQTKLRGHSQTTTLTRFWLFLTTYPTPLIFYMVWTLTKSGHFWTTYPRNLPTSSCKSSLWTTPKDLLRYGQNSSSNLITP